MTTRYVEEADLFVEEIAGAITTEEARSMKQQELDSGHFGPDTAVLCVVYDVETDLGDVREFGVWLRSAYGDFNPRAAYLITGKRSAALMTLLQNQFRDRPVEVFSTLEASIRWLGRSVEDCTAEALGLDVER